MMMMTGERK